MGGCGAYVLVVAKPMCWVGVVGLAENTANSAPIELELELMLSLAISRVAHGAQCHMLGD